MKEKKLIAKIVGVAPLGDPHFEENTQTSPGAYTNSKSKIKTLTSDHKGITLIALVITIIVMLILVAVTVTVALNGGLFSTAKQATTDTQYHADREMLLSAVIGAIGSNAEVDFTELDKNLPNGFTKAEDGGYMSKAGNTFYVDKNGNITDGEPPSGGDYKPVSELFDPNGKDEDEEGYDSNKLHIGDFINYDAGTWTQDEINAIKVGPKDKNGNGTVSPNGVRELPNKSYQFGGFDAHHSEDNDTTSCCRNGNAVPEWEQYNYYKDGDNNLITGWRLFDVDKKEGTITLISAGCPEDFYHPNGINGGYIDEYILSGHKNDNADSLNYLSDTYKNRDWNNYVNATQHAESANAMTKADLDNWYKKYMEVGDDFNSYDDHKEFRNVYKTRYENLIDNYSYYYLASAYDGYLMYYVTPYFRDVDYDGDGRANGVRILITLESNIQLSKSGEKTVKNIEGDEDRSEKPYTYNVWNIQ